MSNINYSTNHREKKAAAHEQYSTNQRGKRQLLMSNIVLIEGKKAAAHEQYSTNQRGKSSCS